MLSRFAKIFATTKIDTSPAILLAGNAAERKASKQKSAKERHHEEA
jgi:hypothetical protein